MRPPSVDLYSTLNAASARLAPIGTPPAAVQAAGASSVRPKSHSNTQRPSSEIYTSTTSSKPNPLFHTHNPVSRSCITRSPPFCQHVQQLQSSQRHSAHSITLQQLNGTYSVEAETIDRWFAEVERTLEEMAATKVDENFKEELGAIERWFGVLSDVERTMAIYTMFHHVSQVQIRFFTTVLQQMARRDPTYGFLAPGSEKGESRPSSFIGGELPAATTSTGEIGQTEFAQRLLALIPQRLAKGPGQGRPLFDRNSVSSVDRSSIGSMGDLQEGLARLDLTEHFASGIGTSPSNLADANVVVGGVNGMPLGSPALHTTGQGGRGSNGTLGPRNFSDTDIVNARTQKRNSGGNFVSVSDPGIGRVIHGKRTSTGGISCQTLNWADVIDSRVARMDSRTAPRPMQRTSTSLESLPSAYQARCESGQPKSQMFPVSRQRQQHRAATPSTGSGQQGQHVLTRTSSAQGSGTTARPTSPNVISRAQFAVPQYQHQQGHLSTPPPQAYQQGTVMGHYWYPGNVSSSPGNPLGTSTASHRARSPLNMANAGNPYACNVQDRPSDRVHPKHGGDNLDDSGTTCVPQSVEGNDPSSGVRLQAIGIPLMASMCDKDGVGSDRSLQPNQQPLRHSQGERSRHGRPVSWKLLNDIPAWLRSLRLHKYSRIFERMDWRDMIQLNDEELERRGVTALGARSKFLKVFDQIKRELDVAEQHD